MNLVETLLDKAAIKAGSFYAVSKATGVPESTLSKIKSGKLGMSPAVAVLVADVAGEDAREASLQAIIANEKDESKRERLAQLLRIGEWRKR